MPQRRRLSRPALALAPALAAGLALTLAPALGGCRSDDAPSTARTGPARTATGARGGTTDSGSRFLDAAGPLGGLTVETPPDGDPGPVTQP